MKFSTFDSTVFIHENAFEIVACQVLTIFMPQCINTLQWRHNGHDNVSNFQPHDCLLNRLLNRLFRRRSKKTSKLCVTGLCAGNSPGTGEFPAQMASCAENVSIWWLWEHVSLWNGYYPKLPVRCCIIPLQVDPLYLVPSVACHYATLDRAHNWCDGITLTH